MKKIVLAAFVLALLPLRAKALNPYDTYNNPDAETMLSYVAMPLAVSSVCDVNGVQPDRVSQLVSYMDQANVAPADFVDVFRYVPVAMQMPVDNEPDFVQWVGSEVDRGVVGESLVSAMETQLRTYDTAIPVSTVSVTTPRYRRRRRPVYYDAFAADYVPVEIRHHCDQAVLEPMALVAMPVAVADVVDIGVPLGRLGDLVVQLNLGNVPPVQFVEMMRYAPAALVYNAPAYGQPDFVQYVQTQVSDGVTGYPLVRSVYNRLPAYVGVTPQIDVPPPTYPVTEAYYVPPVVQNYVPPADPAYVPPVVRTRIATAVAAGRMAYAQPAAAPGAPPVAAPAQVQRLLTAPGGGAVVTNSREARRELAAQARVQRQAPVAVAPRPAPAFAPQVARGRAMGRAVPAAPALRPQVARGRAIAQPAPAPHAIAQAPRPAPAAVAQRRAARGHAVPQPMMSSAPPRPAPVPRATRVARPARSPRGRAAVPPPMMSSSPPRPVPAAVPHPAPPARMGPPAGRPAAHPAGPPQKKGKGH